MRKFLHELKRLIRWFLLLYEGFGVRVGDEGEVMLIELSYFIYYNSQLVTRVVKVFRMWRLCWVEWWQWETRVAQKQGALSAFLLVNDFHELVETAAKAPDVWGLVVLLFHYDDLWRTVPSTSNVAAHCSLLLIVRGQFLVTFDLLRDKLAHSFFGKVALLHLLEQRVSDTLGVLASLADGALRHLTCQTKVTDHYLTILVDENVCRLDITMDDVGRMQEFEGAKWVICYNLQVLFLEAAGLP